MMETESTIIKNIIAGEASQYKILVNKYQNPVFKVILKIVGDWEDAKEITQDVFVKTFESLHQYNSNYKFFSWIYRIAINKALAFVKQKKNFSPFEQWQPTIEYSTENDFDYDLRERQLKESVNQLPENYKSVILLKYYAGLCYDEIAETLGIPEKTVKSRLFDARKMLKNQLTNIDFYSSLQYN